VGLPRGLVGPVLSRAQAPADPVASRPGPMEPDDRDGDAMCREDHCPRASASPWSLGLKLEQEGSP